MKHTWSLYPGVEQLYSRSRFLLFNILIFGFYQLIDRLAHENVTSSCSFLQHFPLFHLKHSALKWGGKKKEATENVFLFFVCLKESEIQLGPGDRGDDSRVLLLGIHRDSDSRRVYLLQTGCKQVHLRSLFSGNNPQNKKGGRGE